MAKSLEAPTKYFQGSALLSDAYRYVSHIGRRFVIIADQLVKELIEDRITKGFQNAGNQCIFLNFNGQSSQKEVMRLAQLAAQADCSGIIGAGGGKAIDVAKLAADVCGLPMVSVPTSASNDGPCSSVASIYTDDGNFVKIQKLKEGPAVVLADTEIISKAPAKLLVSGMGSALATYYEARACHRSGIQNYTGGNRTHTSLALSKLCRDLILKYGEQAKIDVVAKRDTQAVEAIVEANIYLAGVGFENNGCAAAQGIYSGLTAAISGFQPLYGEGIAFGLLAQLAMEYHETGQWNQMEWEQVVGFFKKVGLPITFQQLEIFEVGDDLLYKIAKASCVPKSNIHHMPFEVTEAKVYAALKTLTEIGMD